MERTKVYFVADVHLGLNLKDPADRENRFVSFLKSIRKPETRALYLLGDIWDFWYEYRDVVPKEGARVVSELVQLMDEGIEVYFFEGNHDMWTFSFFESLGMKKLQQPFTATIGGKTFCLGHGDGLGGAKTGYRIMLSVFHNRLARFLFSQLHPWVAFRFGLDWSNSSRRSHSPYHFKREEEPLYKFAAGMEEQPDYFIFGHFHDEVDMIMPSGARFVVLKDWMDGSQPHAEYDVAANAFSLRS